MKPRGVTLVELLVVLAILAFIAVIGTVQVLALIQKNELHSQAQEVKALFQEVPQLVAKYQQPLWVVFKPTGGTGPGGTLTIARNQDGSQPLKAFTIKETIAFGLSGAMEWLNWSPGTVSGTYVIGCDTFNRTLDGSGKPMQVPALGVLTHQKMKSGSLRPAFRWVISVAPVWSVGLARSNPNP